MSKRQCRGFQAQLTQRGHLFPSLAAHKKRPASNKEPREAEEPEEAKEQPEQDEDPPKENKKRIKASTKSEKRPTDDCSLFPVYLCNRQRCICYHYDIAMMFS